jgi:hypothetical protein
MPQLFHPAMNTVARVSIFGALFLAAAGVGLLLILVRSPYATEVGVVREQPIPFSHEHHVGDIGLDCRYCHTSVEQTAFAGIPSTSICMNCHSQLFANSEILAPVRDSLQSGKSIQWTRVHDLPDFVYFNHSIHVHKGVACTTCHGPVNEMPLMWREHSLHMEWCLNCHRDPQKFVGSPSNVFSTGLPGTNRLDNSISQPTKKVDSETSCYTCHR